MTIPAAMAEMRARLAALWPLAEDRTGHPHPPGEEDLPCFAVSATAGGEAEPRAMGAAEYRQAFALTAALRVRTLPATDVEAALHLAADGAEAAILGAPGLLGGAVWSIRPAERDIQVAAGEARVSALVMTFQAVAYGPPAPPPVPGALGLI